MEQSLVLPNRINFSSKKKKDFQPKKPAHKALLWSVKRKRGKAEERKNTIMHDILQYIGKNAIKFKGVSTKNQKRRLIKPNDNAFKKENNENTILFYFKYK
jgi:hypothetical protein